jgi:hypothetical protein
MKKNILALIFLVFIFSSVFAQFAQEEKIRSFSFQVSPFIYLANLFLDIDDDPETYFVAFDFEFQYAVNDILNISISPQLILDKYLYEKIYYAKKTQFILTPGLLYRPFRGRLTGIYIGAYFPIGFTNIKIEKTPDLNDNFTLLGIGISAGHQLVFRNGFTVSFGVGGEKTWSIASGNNTGPNINSENLFNLPFSLILTFRIGYSF